jgi:NAD(P)-dependent dehydrogenase (short-subunit alcohol dehydrogenase family)
LCHIVNNRQKYIICQYDKIGEIDMAGWTVQDMPSQKGRSFLVTGTAGIGHLIALELVRAGGDVIIAGRNEANGQAAVNTIKGLIKGGNVSFAQVDLADLSSIKKFGEKIRSERKSLDVLINNAGLMTPPTRKETADGFELQFGTNYLGPFALTRELIPLLRRGNNPRIVTVGSVADRQATIDFDDLLSEKAYNPMKAYGQSKLADVMFAFELNALSKAHNWGITSMASHPGVTYTGLTEKSNDTPDFSTRVQNFILRNLWRRPVSEGALPTLYAATSPDAKGGTYYGPTGFGGVTGAPGEAQTNKLALNAAARRRLWKVSEELTGVTYE